MRGSRAAIVMASLAVVAANAIVSAGPAMAAGTTWFQSVQRPNEQAPCPANGSPAPQSGWIVTDWAKSWEEWPNAGRGGWTCTRTIIWGKSGGGDRTPPPVTDYPPGVGCVSENGAGGYIDFLGGFFLEAGAQVWSNAGCTVPDVGVTYSNPRIYAPAGYDAQALCLEFSGLPYANGPYGQDTWDCSSSPAG